MARTVPAVQRALALLELFLGEREELSSRDITQELGLPRTTTHELIHTLLDLGYLIPSPMQPGNFRLGVRVLQLGMTYASRLQLATEGREVAEQIAHGCAETVHVAVRDGPGVVYIVKVDSTRAVRMVSAQGRRIPAHCTSVGKVLLAQLSDDEIDELYAGTAGLEQLTPNSITDIDKLKKSLKMVRYDGIAFEREESTPEIACVGAPVRDHTGAVVAAMSIAVPVTRWGSRSDDDWAELVRRGAAMLSRRLGSPE